MEQNFSEKMGYTQSLRESVVNNLINHLSEIVKMREYTDLMIRFLENGILHAPDDDQHVLVAQSMPDRFSTWLDKSVQVHTTGLKNIQDDFYSCFGKKVKKVDTVYNMFYIFLDAYREARGRTINIENKIYDWLDDHHLSLLASVGTAVYLEQWLEKDTNARESLYHFVSRPYNPIVREKNNAYNAPDPTSRTRLERAYADAYSVLESAKRQQQREENIPVSHKQRVVAGKRQLDYITLTWCDTWVNKNLHIIKLLFLDDEFLNASVKTEKSVVDKLQCYFSGYHRLIKETNALGEKSNPSIVDTRKFVCRSMLLHRLERTYRIQLRSLMAKKLCNKPDDEKNYSKDMENVFVGRYRVTNRDEHLFLPIWHQSLEHFNYCDENSFSTKIWNILRHEGFVLPDVKKYYCFTDYSLDVVSNEYYVENIFQTGGEQQSAVERVLHQKRRIALLDAVLCILTLYRPKSQTSWTDDLFLQAALFYQKQYPVASALMEPGCPDPNSAMDSSLNMGPEEIQKFYDYLRKFYIDMDLGADEVYCRARKIVKTEWQKNKKQKCFKKIK